MSKHDHTWEPVDGKPASYKCLCGAIGMRNLRTGTIEVTRASRPRFGRQPHGFVAVAKSSRLPSMSEQEAGMGAPPWER